MFKQSAFLDQQNFNAFDQVCGELRRSREAEHHCGRVGPVANRSSRFVISGFRWLPVYARCQEGLGYGYGELVICLLARPSMYLSASRIGVQGCETEWQHSIHRPTTNHVGPLLEYRQTRVSRTHTIQWFWVLFHQIWTYNSPSNSPHEVHCDVFWALQRAIHPCPNVGSVGLCNSGTARADLCDGLGERYLRTSWNQLGLLV